MTEPRSSFDRRAYIVDDDAALRNTIRRILTGLGILTEEFGSAECFLIDQPRRPLGCVLLDVSLPGMSGIELLHRIKGGTAPHPVIMISGHGDIPVAVEAVKAGALDFVEKPFRAEQLRQAVESGFKLIAEIDRSHSSISGTLSERERETLRAFAGGAQNKAVAEALGISIRTVEMHRANIIKKLGVDNLTQALFLAKDGGYLS